MIANILNHAASLGLQYDISPSQAIAVYDLKTVRHRYLEVIVEDDNAIELAEYRKLNGRWRVTREVEVSCLEDALREIEAFRRTTMNENDIRNVKACDLDGKGKKFTFQVNLLAFFDKLFRIFREEPKADDIKDRSRHGQ